MFKGNAKLWEAIFKIKEEIFIDQFDCYGYRSGSKTLKQIVKDLEASVYQDKPITSESYFRPIHSSRPSKVNMINELKNTVTELRTKLEQERSYHQKLVYDLETKQNKEIAKLKSILNEVVDHVYKENK